MQREEVKKQVVQIVADQMGAAESEINEDTKLQDDLGADSLDMVELMFEFEDEYQISIDDEDVEKWSTVKDIIDYVEKTTD